MTLINMIKGVIEEGDTAKQIVGKLNTKHPEYFYKKATQLDTTKKALAQMHAEVGSIMIQAPEDFNIDRSGPRNKYSIKHKPSIKSKRKLKTNSIKKRVEKLEVLLRDHINEI